MSNWYVSPAGSDANGGTSEADAKATVQAGIDLMSPADRLLIKYGVYTLTTGLTFPASRGGTSRLARSVIEGYVTTPGDAPDGSAAPTITTTTSSINLFTFQSGAAGAFLLFRSLRFLHAGAVRGAGIIGATGAGSIQGGSHLDRCEFSGCSNGYSSGSRFAIDYARRCTFRNCTATGVASASLFTGTWVDECRFLDNTSHGCDIGTGLQISPRFRRCVFSGNGGNGINMPVTTRTVELIVQASTFEGNGGDGILFSYTTGTPSGLITDSVFWGNTGYGVNGGGSGGGAFTSLIGTNNAYGSNSSGPPQGFTTELYPVSLSADPFTNAAGEDWAPNAASGGGLLVRYAGAGAADIGAVQHPASGGGSTGGYIIGA
ncbi:: Beta_helix [Gemmata massiliana]|uniref:: Beta_helix n=1 Tax=Gemmata massiliana TaxID=1210884 RepID=A0A6P2CXE8_9BACT|nr:right-handed parallel beta-helix repeat-containing protein [Gemmata massiliana]VTR92825.1 : Beta_helix [Gemmata massiliana]